MNPNRAFVDRVLGAVDSGDFPAFFAALDPDARFVFGSAPPAHGHDAIGALIGTAPGAYFRVTDFEFDYTGD